MKVYLTEMTNEKSDQVEKLSEPETRQVETVGAVAAEKTAPEPGTMKIDLHCHSEASHDSSTPLALIPDRCRQQKIRVQAITDHNQVWGAQKLQQMVEDEGCTDLTIIVGEEVSSTEGEIVGLFLTEKIEAGLTPEETVKRIKGQGGLVLIPHGFDPMKRWRLRPQALERITEGVDIVETFNARISQLRWNQAAVSWCKEHQVLMSAGSDAHTLADIGSAWVEAPLRNIDVPGDLLKALNGGTPMGVWTHPVLAYLYKMIDRTRRRLSAGLGLGGN